MLPDRYQRFLTDISALVPQGRLFTDPLRTLAYGTDASFYRLIPKIVVRADTEAEVAAILKAADHADTPVTFRAAGTSLSGQAVSDSVLIVAGGSWNRYEIIDNGGGIRLQPGVIGGHANRYLAPYGRKIGPDPASINSAMIGGIAANNASGMCCGTAQNSYRTVTGMRILFQDGTLLDTADPASRDEFRYARKDLLDAVDALGKEVRANTALAERIRRKYKIKNTTGFSLNALVDFEDPFDILLHLMIGSEGTLGFISEITYQTVVEHPCKASALMIFPQIENAATAAAILRDQPVAAVELMDRASLRSVENKAGMPDYLKVLSPQTAALLVETRAFAAEELQGQVRTVTDSLKRVPFERPFTFTDRVAEYTALWNIRKGLFPAVGAVRETGTTVIIEDVAFPIDRLAKATLHLQDIMRRFRYDEAIIFGHALEGNLHFCFTQDFDPPEEVERYRGFMHEVCDMVVNAYDGSLKAEHGTGRNMAPYVELEWGREAYTVMQRIKEIFDPKNLLNPGVIINANPRAHIENLKPLPRANPIVDKCIECGFCEVNCPSRNLTLTPRQRIVVQREIARLRATCENPARLAELETRLPLPGRGDLRRRRVVRRGLPGGHQHRRAHEGVAQPNREPRGPGGGRLCRRAFQPDRRRGAGGPQDRGCRPRSARLDPHGEPGRRCAPPERQPHPPLDALHAARHRRPPAAIGEKGWSPGGLLPQLHQPHHGTGPGRPGPGPAACGYPEASRKSRLRRPLPGDDGGPLLRHPFRKQGVHRPGGRQGPGARGRPARGNRRRPPAGAGRHQPLPLPHEESDGPAADAARPGGVHPDASDGTAAAHPG